MFRKAQKLFKIEIILIIFQKKYFINDSNKFS